MLVTCLRCNRHVDTGDVRPGEIVTCACGLGLLVPEPPRDAGKMGCPACGAPVDPDLRACVFCDTRLATVLCPACFGRVFEGAKHCPHCGEGLVDRQVVHHGDATQHNCPRCQDRPELRLEVVAGCALEGCAACHGIWVDREVVERLYHDRQAAGVVTRESARQGKGPARQALNGAPEGYIPCPVCGSFMNRANFGRFSGVVIDVCKDHGTWFDGDELMHVLTFIASGGLDKAAEREREELKQEMRRIKEQQRTMATAPGSGGAGLALGSGSLSLQGRHEAQSVVVKAFGWLLKALFR